MMADIPGLIEGASEGAGLGFRFLKHLSRTRLLLHMIDVLPADNSDPVENAIQIVKELEKFSPTLAAKDRWLVMNKVDLVDDETVEALKQSLREALSWEGEIYEISALSSDGCDRLCNDLMTSVEEHRVQLKEDEEYLAAQQEKENAMAFEIRQTIEASKTSRKDMLEEEEDQDWDDDWDEEL